MKPQDIPTTIAEIERLLTESRQQLEATRPPDVSSDVRNRIERNPTRSTTPAATATGRPATTTDGDWNGDNTPVLRSGDRMNEPDPPSWRRETLKLAAGIIAFVALAGVLILVFESQTGDPDDPSDGAAPPATSDTPTAVLAVAPSATGQPLVDASPTPAPTGTAAETATEQPIATATPTLGPTATLPIGEFTPSPESVVLTITTPPGSNRVRAIQPADPLSLEPLPGYDPIEFDVGRAGGYIEVAVAPDGASIALVVHVPGDGQTVSGKSSLYILDHQSWQATLIFEWDLFLGNSNASHSRYSPDGRSLFWVARADGQRTLMSYDLDQAALGTQLPLPEAFSGTETAVNADGNRLAIFGATVEGSLPIEDGYVLGDFAKGNAQVLIADLDSNTVTTTVDLDGVITGAVPIEDAEGDSYPVQLVAPGLAWDSDASRLYVAHADAPRVTVVDLEQGTIQDTFSLDESASLIDRFTDWLFPSAQAVARAFSNGHAVLTGDGRLAVAMIEEHLSNDRQQVEEGTHSPVWLVDTESGDVLWDTDPGGVQGMALSPDGEHLLVHTYPRITALLNPADGAGEHRLSLLDLETGDIVTQIALPGRPRDVRGSMIVSNELVYIRLFSDTGSQILVIDPTSLAVVGSWQWAEGEPNIHKLIPLP